MTPDGRFRAPPRTPLAARIAVSASIVAMIAGGLGAAALALWLALALIPVALIAVLVAYAAFRVQLWRSGKSLAPGPVRRP